MSGVKFWFVLSNLIRKEVFYPFIVVGEYIPLDTNIAKPFFVIKTPKTG
jgi:hypothetical protein